MLLIYRCNSCLNTLNYPCACTFVPCTLYLGCVPPLLEVALRKFFPLLSVFCSSRPCCSLPLHDVIFPSHFGSAPRSSSFPHLPLCCAYCPPIVLHSCHMSSPSPPLCFTIFSLYSEANNTEE